MAHKKSTKEITAVMMPNQLTVTKVKMKPSTPLTMQPSLALLAAIRP